jgi:hypothetical protein
MKPTLSAVVRSSLLALLAIASIGTASALAILEDDFESYGDFSPPYKGPWSKGMQGGVASWTSLGAPASDDAGPVDARAIVQAPERTGRCFKYTETSSTANHPAITTKFEAFSDEEWDWQLTFDFSAEEINNPDRLGVAMITLDARVVGMMFLKRVNNYGSAPSIRLCFVTTDASQEEVKESVEFTPDAPVSLKEAEISCGVWYRAIMRGNNKAKALSYRIEGTDTEEVHTPYISDVNAINIVTIGDRRGSFLAPQSSVYIDNVKLETVRPGMATSK